MSWKIFFATPIMYALRADEWIIYFWVYAKWYLEIY